MSIATRLVEACIAFEPGAADLLEEIVGGVKIVNLTDEQVERLVVLLKKKKEDK